MRFISWMLANKYWTGIAAIATIVFGIQQCSSNNGNQTIVNVYNGISDTTAVEKFEERSNSRVSKSRSNHDHMVEESSEPHVYIEADENLSKLPIPTPKKDELDVINADWKDSQYIQSTGD